MLNFCPDLLNEPMELYRATREIFFLLDRNSSMSGSNMERLKVQFYQHLPKQGHVCSPMSVAYQREPMYICHLILFFVST